MSVPTPPTNEPAWQIPPALRLQLLALLSADPTKPATMTYEEFLDWATEDTLAEWVEGKVIMTSPASARHQMIAAFLHNVLSSYTTVHGLGTVLIAPFQMKLPNSGREPDVLFLAAEHADRLRPAFLDGPADLVVEIISKESVGRDRGEKFEEYREAGIAEYWLIDPRLQQAEFYRLDARGRYDLIAVDGADGIYRSEVVPGFWLRVDWLWRQPLLDPAHVMMEIDRELYLRYLQA